jgi:superfamily II DNA or RNA helicase
MSKYKIEILDEVHCKANAKARSVIKFALGYKATHWRRGEWAMESNVVRQFLITGRKGTGGHFLTGLLPRVERYCAKRMVDIRVNGDREFLQPQRKPQLNGIKFRADQRRHLRKLAKVQRGKIIAPTGSGKTIIQFGLASMFPKAHILLLAHTNDLVNQLIDEAIRFQINLPPLIFPKGGKECTEQMETINQHNNGSLVITTIQSFSKVPPELYSTVVDIAMVDEGHHVASLDGQYGKFLQRLLAPRRYGFTASDQKMNRKIKLINEGLLGPVIANLTIKEGIKLGIIAKPKVKLINVPYDVKTNGKCTRYTDYYTHGIVRNKKRNDAIRRIVGRNVSQKKATLIIVEKLEHGKILSDLISRRENVKVSFISGATKQGTRNKFKKRLLDGKIHALVVSRIWMEGINIPNLRAVIYAAGMKEQKRTIQAMGRGFRTTKTKKKILLYDFLDPYKYLSSHSVERLHVYNKEKWL